MKNIRVLIHEVLRELRKHSTLLTEIRDALVVRKTIADLYDIKIEKPEAPDILGCDTIDVFKLPVRCRDAINRLGVKTIGELVECTEGDLLNLRNVGDVSVDKIKEALRAHGLKLKDEAQSETSSKYKQHRESSNLPTGEGYYQLTYPDGTHRAVQIFCNPRVIRRVYDGKESFPYNQFVIDNQDATWKPITEEAFRLFVALQIKKDDTREETPTHILPSTTQNGQNGLTTD
jgi:hypothetical protein